MKDAWPEPRNSTRSATSFRAHRVVVQYAMTAPPRGAKRAVANGSLGGPLGRM